MGLNSYIAKQFSRPAGVGGRAVSYIMNRQNRPLYDETIRLLQLSDHHSVLDIGCGNGFVMNMLAKRYNCRLTGMDISESIIKDASKRNRRFTESSQMNFVCQDIGKMSFADSSFDTAYTINTVYFWGNLAVTMAAIRRLLKPDGVFVNALYTNETLSRFSHTQIGYQRFTREQLTDAGESAGFSVKMIPMLNGAAYCVIYQKTERR